MTSKQLPRVAIVGGGLAGLAAAVRLVEQGIKVELFEARRRLGGRAGSFTPTSNSRSLTPDSRLLTTDHGQHVSMGCCTALADLLDRTGLADTFEAHRRMHFIGPDGRRRDLAAASWLPAPLHLLPSLLRFDWLSPGERWRIVRAVWSMKNMARSTNKAPLPVPGACAKAIEAANELSNNKTLSAACCPLPTDHDQSADTWLRSHGQSTQAIDQFWSPVLVSALSEMVDHASLRLSRKVIMGSLLGTRRAYELHIPRRPLVEIFDQRLGRWLESRGVTIHRLTRITRIEGNSQRAQAIVPSLPTARCLLPTARCRLPIVHDAIILAVPWDRVAGLLSPELLAAMPEVQRLDEIRPAAITSVHLTYDRPITELPHAMLVGRLGQWLFAKPDNRYQVVISASHRLVDCPRNELVEQIKRELAEVFPEAAGARVLSHRVVVQPRAVFSASPGIESLRPAQKTPIKNLALAGDWTATGWPATMESAVRSGNAAAEVIAGQFRG